MTNLSSPNTACQKAIQFLLAIITILIIGQLITWIPVMERLRLAGEFNAAELVWFGAKLSALIMFYFFARASITAIPNTGGIQSFVRNIAEPLTILVIVIVGQELFWQILEPFVQATGKKLYYSIAILFIVSISIWLVINAYQSALYLFDASQTITKYLSRFIPKSDKKMCQACHNPVGSNAEFCSHCGYKITEQINCSECGKVILADEKFCQHCGTEVIQKTMFNE